MCDFVTGGKGRRVSGSGEEEREDVAESVPAMFKYLNFGDPWTYTL